MGCIKNDPDFRAFNTVGIKKSKSYLFTYHSLEKKNRPIYRGTKTNCDSRKSLVHPTGIPTIEHLLKMMHCI